MNTKSRHGKKLWFRNLYDETNRYLRSTPNGPKCVFLNFGYDSHHDDLTRAFDLARNQADPCAATLIAELMGNCNLAGKRVLDVGCGRGGTVQLISQLFRTDCLAAVDQSAEAIRFCTEALDPGIRFVVADAELLPFRRHSFDVILNIESSHCYPEINSFYREVHRLLMDGGTFLYTDMFSEPQLESNVSLLRNLGFKIAVNRDITANVLSSCQKSTPLFGPNPESTVEQRMRRAAPRMLEAFSTRALVYQLFRMVKRPCY